MEFAAQIYRKASIYTLRSHRSLLPLLCHVTVGFWSPELLLYNTAYPHWLEAGFSGWQKARPLYIQCFWNPVLAENMMDTKTFSAITRFNITDKTRNNMVQTRKPKSYQSPTMGISHSFSPILGQHDYSSRSVWWSADWVAAYTFLLSQSDSKTLVLLKLPCPLKQNYGWSLRVPIFENSNKSTEFL